MSQVSDVSIANQGFSAFRTELNSILGALNTSHIGTSAPASLAAGSIWVDTSGGVTAYKLYFYDGAQSIEMGTINTTANTVDWTDSSVTVANDSITLAKMASGTDGNIISYDASGNPVAIATGSAAQVLTSAGAGAPPTFATATVPDNAITLAKMAGGTDGNIISYDASGNPVAIATGSSGQVLTSAGAGAPPTFAAAAGGGKVLQVQSYGNQTAVNTTSASYQTTGILDAITCSATSSKVLVICSVNMAAYGAAHLQYPQFALFRDSTEISDRQISGRADSVGNFQFGDNIVFTILDSPSSTSAITYTVKMKNDSSYGGTIYINDGGSNSSITLMEIGA